MQGTSDKAAINAIKWPWIKPGVPNQAGNFPTKYASGQRLKPFLSA
jgi:hypothetical protein